MRIGPFLRRVLAPCLLLLLAVTVARRRRSSKFNWPQWRGPNDDGISQETGLPTAVGPRRRTSPGRSPCRAAPAATPAIWGDRLFLTSEDLDNKEIVLLCVSTAGKKLWRRKAGLERRPRPLHAATRAITPRPRPAPTASTSTPSPAPATWPASTSTARRCGPSTCRTATARYGAQHGLHNTPLLDGDRLYVQYFIRKTAYVVALNTANGKEIWKVERQERRHRRKPGLLHLAGDVAQGEGRLPHHARQRLRHRPPPRRRLAKSGAWAV